MPYQAIAPVIPNISNQGEAVAGSSGVIFTATDRQIIQERAGEIDRKRSFKEIFAKNPLTPEVENEETGINPEPDINEIEGRIRDHRQMIKHSPLYTPHEHVEIRNELPDTYEEKAGKEIHIVGNDKFSRPAKPNPSTSDDEVEIHKETVAIVKELKLDPNEILNKFSLPKKEILGLVKRIKTLHLKRLLSETQKDFEMLSEEIKTATLARSKPEAKIWMDAKLDQLSLESARYKLGILQSMQSMELNDQRKKNIKWLKKVVARLAKV